MYMNIKSLDSNLLSDCTTTLLPKVGNGECIFVAVLVRHLEGSNPTPLGFSVVSCNYIWQFFGLSDRIKRMVDVYILTLYSD
ncbi:hypothetical protein BH18THE2_BH18THE2_22490 [soil metagenome]